MKRKWAMAVCAFAICGCMAGGCGNAQEKETKAETETVAETKEQAETQQLSESDAETETEAVTGEETDEAQETEDTEEQKAAEPKTMYVVSDVYIRQEMDASSEAVAVAHLGDEVTMYEEDGKWCRVTLGEKEGYVVKEYLTESKEEAEQAQRSEEDARRAAEAAAQQTQQQAQPSGGGKYEVSRQAFDDCDGSGHGYYEIHYSDGSVATEEY